MSNSELSKLLLDWYQDHGRDLPWRVKGGAHPDPYIVFVSEIMLQQTTVATVIPYFQKFIRRFPTIFELAAANLDEIYQYWQGLGYYSRARSLHATAQIIADKFAGEFPQNKEQILKLKGIGPYTAASLLALGYNLPETVIDGNVIRVICRLYHLDQPTEKIMPQIKKLAKELSSKERPADYASAIMDLGAVICTPKKPQCPVCPWHESCLSQGKAEIEQIPCRHKPPKVEKNGFVYLITDQNGSIFIRKRIEKGLLSGLWEFPWSSEKELFPAAVDSGLKVSHIFTHIKLTLNIRCLQNNALPDSGLFVAPEDLCSYPFSTLMKKVWKKAGPVLFTRGKTLQ